MDSCSESGLILQRYLDTPRIDPGLLYDDSSPLLSPPLLSTVEPILYGGNPASSLTSAFHSPLNIMSQHHHPHHAPHPHNRSISRHALDGGRNGSNASVVLLGKPTSTIVSPGTSATSLGLPAKLTSSTIVNPGQLSPYSRHSTALIPVHSSNAVGDFVKPPNANYSHHSHSNSVSGNISSRSGTGLLTQDLTLANSHSMQSLIQQHDSTSGPFSRITEEDIAAVCSAALDLCNFFKEITPGQESNAWRDADDVQRAENEETFQFSLRERRNDLLKMRPLTKSGTLPLSAHSPNRIVTMADSEGATHEYDANARAPVPPVPAVDDILMDPPHLSSDASRSSLVLLPRLPGQ
eukprot:gene3867-4839_t